MQESDGRLGTAVCKGESSTAAKYLYTPHIALSIDSEPSESILEHLPSTINTLHLIWSLAPYPLVLLMASLPLTTNLFWITVSLHMLSLSQLLQPQLATRNYPVHTGHITCFPIYTCVGIDQPAQGGCCPTPQTTPTYQCDLLTHP